MSDLLVVVPIYTTETAVGFSLCRAAASGGLGDWHFLAPMKWGRGGFMASAGFMASVAGFMASVAIALAGFIALVASSARAPAAKAVVASASASAVRNRVMVVSLGCGARCGPDGALPRPAAPREKG
ncbi:MAG: hypothetical protein E5V89_19300 [Mesorhizobium sp.]|nr:MAG: hypothetical protein E5V89_19300 [Mesorhizobium sp.]